MHSALPCIYHRHFSIYQSAVPSAFRTSTHHAHQICTHCHPKPPSTSQQHPPPGNPHHHKSKPTGAFLAQEPHACSAAPGTTRTRDLVNINYQMPGNIRNQIPDIRCQIPDTRYRMPDLLADCVFVPAFELAKGTRDESNSVLRFQ